MASSVPSSSAPAENSSSEGAAENPSSEGAADAAAATSATASATGAENAAQNSENSTATAGSPPVAIVCVGMAGSYTSSLCCAVCFLEVIYMKEEKKKNEILD